MLTEVPSDRESLTEYLITTSCVDSLTAYLRAAAIVPQDFLIVSQRQEKAGGSFS